MKRNRKSLVGIILGSKSDWETMEHAANTLEELGVPHEVRVLSAHRTPDQLLEYATNAEDRGLEVIIAAAGGAAHLAGVTAAQTLVPSLRERQDSPAPRRGRLMPASSTGHAPAIPHSARISRCVIPRTNRPHLPHSARQIVRDVVVPR